MTVRFYGRRLKLFPIGKALSFDGKRFPLVSVSALKSHLVRYADLTSRQIRSETPCHRRYR